MLMPTCSSQKSPLVSALAGTASCGLGWWMAASRISKAAMAVKPQPTKDNIRGTTGHGNTRRDEQNKGATAIIAFAGQGTAFFVVELGWGG